MLSIRIYSVQLLSPPLPPTPSLLPLFAFHLRKLTQFLSRISLSLFHSHFHFYFHSHPLVVYSTIMLLLCSLIPMCNNDFCLRSFKRYSTRAKHNLIAIFFAYHLQTVFMFIFKSKFIALC